MEPTDPVSTNPPLEYPTLTFDPIPPPPPITINELLTLKEVIQKKEEDDRVICGQINLPNDMLRQKLFDWAVAGFPSAFEISRVIIEPPNKCSDGVIRNIYEYIFFISGKQLDDHLQLIRNQVSGIQVSTTVQARNTIVILVSKE